MATRSGATCTGNCNYAMFKRSWGYDVEVLAPCVLCMRLRCPDCRNWDDDLQAHVCTTYSTTSDFDMAEYYRDAAITRINCSAERTVMIRAGVIKLGLLVKE